MKLKVLHRTRYEYAAPVKESFNEARLQPTSADGQECQAFELKVAPATRVAHYHDFYLNYVHFFELIEPHEFLDVEAVSMVTTTAANCLPHDATPAPMARLPECLRMERCYDFLQASTYVDDSPEVWRLALDASEGWTDAWQTTLALMHFVRGNFAYAPNSTHVHTHMAEVLQERRGVCQDFAHVMLGMCRALRIPARYVSGYLYNGPAEHLIGAQASHAWCEVYLPGIGWRGLDPTNDRQVDDHYVKVAHGRDYADIVPLKGTYKGTRDKTMAVEVQVTRCADASDENSGGEVQSP
ncbi:MAG: transglutaminase family protein [Verrucomicrobiota bacterium]